MTFTLKNISLASGLVTNIAIDGTQVLSIGSEIHGDVVDCTGLIALPGLVDLHTHLREPGK